jgi:Protein of unknown function (DUF3105)
MSQRKTPRSTSAPTSAAKSGTGRSGNRATGSSAGSSRAAAPASAPADSAADPTARPTAKRTGSPSAATAKPVDGTRSRPSGTVSVRKAPKGGPGTAPAAAAAGSGSGGTGSRGPTSRGPTKRPGKSIVNQKQTPWGLIVTTIVVVIFAAGIVTYAVTRPHANSTPYLNELADAKKISGITFRQEPNRNHLSGIIQYDSSPPVGGNHSPVWADCSGTIYPAQIANENAVHAMEHGAVWITYRPGLANSQVAKLQGMVNGIDRMLMTPYAGLKTNISLQAWGYQLFVDNASDPRIEQFIDTLRLNPKTTPENGASCDNPTFKASPSTPGHPTDS